MLIIVHKMKIYCTYFVYFKHDFYHVFNFNSYSNNVNVFPQEVAAKDVSHCRFAKRNEQPYRQEWLLQQNTKYIWLDVMINDCKPSGYKISFDDCSEKKTCLPEREDMFTLHKTDLVRAELQVSGETSMDCRGSIKGNVRGERSVSPICSM